MSENLGYLLIGVLALAVVGLGIKISMDMKIKSGNKSTNKTVMKNINAKGDVVGRDKKNQ